VGSLGGVDKKTEIDPTQAAARSDGRSPRAILISTFSDEQAVHTAGRAKIFGVSVKDRGAISMAGHVGKAFWFSKKAGEFVSSTYYYEQYPDWVTDWNAKRLADSYEGKSWELLQDRSKYGYRDTDDRPYETALPGYGRVFPHPFDKRSFGGAGVPAHQISSLAHPVDIAVTLSVCVGAKPPSAAAGEPLLEVLNQ
jgi:hypothetical protein